VRLTAADPLPRWASAQPDYSEIAFCKSVAVVWKVALSCALKLCKALMMPMPTMAAISAYSIAVAPDSFLLKSEIVFFMESLCISLCHAHPAVAPAVHFARRPLSKARNKANNARNW